MTKREPCQRTEGGSPSPFRCPARVLLGVLGRSDRPLDASEVACVVGLHRNSARVRLEALVSAGLARRRAERRSTRGCPRVLYEKTGASANSYLNTPPRGDIGYQELAQVLVGQMTELADVANEAILQAGDGRPPSTPRP